MNPTRYFGHYCLEENKPELLALFDSARNGVSPFETGFSSGKKVWFHCEECGNSWTAPPNKAHKYPLATYSVVTKRELRTHCIFCRGERACDRYNIFTEFPRLKRYLDFERTRQDWENLKGAKGEPVFNPAAILPKSHSKIYIGCNNPGCQYRKPSPVCIKTFVTALDKYRCPECEGGKHSEATERYNLEKTSPDIATELDAVPGNQRKAATYLPYSNERVKFKCSACDHIYESKISNRTKLGRGCPRCNDQFTTSFIENALHYYLEQLDREVRNRYVDERTGCQIDVFLPSFGVAIEFSSKYYHKDISAERSREAADINKLKRLSQYYDVYSLQEYEISAELKDVRYHKGIGIEDLVHFIVVPPFDFSQEMYQHYNLELYQLMRRIAPSRSNYPNVNLERDALKILKRYIHRPVKNPFSEHFGHFVGDWVYARNENLQPDWFGVSCKIKFHWQCRTCKRIYLSTIHNRTLTNTDRCPLCARAGEHAEHPTLLDRFPALRVFENDSMNEIPLEKILPNSKELYRFKLHDGSTIPVKISNLYSWLRENPQKAAEAYLEAEFRKLYQE